MNIQSEQDKTQFFSFYNLYNILISMYNTVFVTTNDWIDYFYFYNRIDEQVGKVLQKIIK